MTTDELLSERAKTHGNFVDTAAVATNLKRMIRNHSISSRLHYMQIEALDMIALKIARILTGDADCVDHWEDIAGYAMLVTRDIKNRRD